MNKPIETKIELYQQLSSRLISNFERYLWCETNTQAVLMKIQEVFRDTNWLEWTVLELEQIGWISDDRNAYPPTWCASLLQTPCILYDANGKAKGFLNNKDLDPFNGEYMPQHLDYGIPLNILNNHERIENSTIQIVYSRKWMWKNMLAAKRTLLNMGIETRVRHGLTKEEYYDINGLDNLEPAIAQGVKCLVTGYSLLCKLSAPKKDEI